MIATLKEKHGEHPNQTHTYHAGWELGYIEGKLAVLTDLPEDEGDK